MDSTKKLSAGFFDWMTYKGTAYNQREATRNAFRVPECYKNVNFDCPIIMYLWVYKL